MACFGLTKAFFALALAGLLAISGGPAHAGAWTREKGEGLAIFGLSIHQLLPSENYDGFNRVKNEASLYAEYGLSDRITLVGRLAWQSMQITDLQSEEIGYTVQLKPPYDPLRDDPEQDYDGDGVNNRDDPPPALPPIYEQRTKTSYFTAPPETGVGGIEAGARYRLLQRGPSVVSAQIIATVPGNGENQNNLRFGQGGATFEGRLLAGRSFGRSTFVNVSAGFRTAPGGRPDEVRLDVTAGTHIARGVRVMAQTYSVWSVGGAADYLEYSGHRGQLSVLWPIDSFRRVQISALATLGRDNMSRETALMASVWRTF